jgi:hypothetical protein
VRQSRSSPHALAAAFAVGLCAAPPVFAAQESVVEAPVDESGATRDVEPDALRMLHAATLSTATAVDPAPAQKDDKEPVTGEQALPRPVRAGLVGAAGAAGALVGGVVVGAPLVLPAVLLYFVFTGGFDSNGGISGLRAWGWLLTVPAGAGMGALFGSCLGLAPFLRLPHALGVGALTGLLATATSAVPLLIAHGRPGAPVPPISVPMWLGVVSTFAAASIVVPTIGAAWLLPEEE